MNHNTQKRTSFAFLMEMLWVCGFFILAACIFVLAFVKADQLSRHADSLNQAVLTVENVIEDTFSGYEKPLSDGTQSEKILYYSSDWSRTEDSRKAAYRIVLCTSWEDSLVTVNASAQYTAGPENKRELYTLEGIRYVPPQIE